ncbi:Glycosyltransferase Family 2 protein [Trametes cinnabarina]|uniref:Glycosyltransferase Family 2 protein n=1 Tax=Pycnoporus cinnabarinus TaxID=5643 RepID=A0A060SI51_PYCCI|nr:Glycosyltransferase Family 2 protein [Trametes cinnabarina]
MLKETDLILITGAYGFIVSMSVPILDIPDSDLEQGGHVARKLHSLGYRLRVTDVAHKASNGQLADSGGEIVTGNLCDPSFCARIVVGVDYVLHFAATMGGMGTIHEANDFVIYQENHSMTSNLVSACVAAGVRGFFYASSACVYPESLQAPGRDVSLAESDVWKNPPPHPQGLYGLEKLVSELVLYQQQGGMEVKIARFHNVYGPFGTWVGGREKVPAAFLRKALAAKLASDAPVAFEIWGDGRQRRSFCFIEDAVEAVLRLLGSDCSEPVNVGSDQAVSIQRLAELSLAASGVDLADVVFEYKTDRPVGVGSRNSDNTFVHERLGWEPAYSLEEGMRITGKWICSQILENIASMSQSERKEYLHLLQTSEMVDLRRDANTFAILLPITSRGLNSPHDCLANLGRFARSLAASTADDVARLGERYAVRVYLAIDNDDDFLWQVDGGDLATPILRDQGFRDITTLRCDRPRGHVCALWRDCARRAYEDGCDYYILMGDDVVLEEPDWMSSMHQTFARLAATEHVPHGIGCVAFTDTSFPGMPTFPAVHRTHMDIFGGDVIPDCFTNQDGDPFLFQLYRRWGCSKMIHSRVRNELGGSEAARYEKIPAAGWTFGTLDDATVAVDTWLRHHSPVSKRKLTLDVIIPCYRVDMQYIDAFLRLRQSSTIEVMFIIIVDDPLSPRVKDLMQKHGHRPDVRIRINKQNLGASASRNRGLQESAAEWVHFLDDDVTPDEDLLVEAEKAIRAHPKAAGFVGGAQFPSADKVFTTAIHLAGVTYFWNIAEKIEFDVPWGVTANLIARRNVLDNVQFDLQFPKTGGGEDIDFCRKKREFSIAHGGEPFWAAPTVRVTHPWWYCGRRSYWRFYMWSKGDGGLVKLYPKHCYRDAFPNGAECLLLSVVVFLSGTILGLTDLGQGRRAALFGIAWAASTMLSNVVFDLFRHLVLHPGRVRDMKTTVAGIWWICAIVEGAFLRVFSEWGRVVGILDRDATINKVQARLVASPAFASADLATYNYNSFPSTTILFCFDSHFASMVSTRRRALTAQSASTTPSTTVSPVFSAGASPPSTPQTSNMGENEDELDHYAQKRGMRGATAATKKRALEEDGNEEMAAERAPKRRVMQQAAYVEIASTKTAKTRTFESNETLRVTTRGKPAAAILAVNFESEEEILESDDSGSDFNPEEESVSDLEDDLDEDDEEVMVDAAVRESLQTARQDAEHAAGLSSAGAGSSKARPPTNKAAALRAAAAERRLARASEVDVIDLTSDFEALSSESDSEEEPLSKGKEKQAAKAKAAKSMTLTELRKARREERKEARLRRNATATEEAKLREELGRRLTYAEKATIALRRHHPELLDVWGDVERRIEIIEPKKSEQPPNLKVRLLPFQLESLSWFKEQEKGVWRGGMLADEMGMGKTIQMIALMVSDYGAKPNLVVAPTVAIMQWRNEIEMHTDNMLKTLVWHGASRESSISELKKYDVVLTSYAVLESCFRKQHSGFKRKGKIVKEKSPLHAIEWNRVILDEAHNIKERSTNTAKATFELNARYRWCLSGTPLQNRVGELYSLVRFLGGDPFSYYFYCGHSPMKHTCFWNNEILTPIQKNGMLGPGQIAFKKLKILLDRMMLRRTKIQRADDLGLPPRTVIIRRDYFSPEEKELYLSLFSDAKRQFNTYVDEGTVLNNYSNIFSLLTRMRQMACHPDLVLRSKNNAGMFIQDDTGEGTVCRLCNEYAEDAIQAKCRHIFDRECIKQYVEASIEQTPACPVCHVALTIDLEAPALELEETAKVRQGILGRLDLNKWRSSTKIEALVEELSNLRQQDATTKSIVFSQFVNFLDLIAFRLQRAGFNVCRLEGTMSPQARDATIKYFMNNVHVTVFLVSLKAGGVALNLTEASRVYLMDSWWNPAVEYQAMDRIHRLGQHRPVQAIKLVVEDSIESRIIQLQEKKAAMVDATLSADDSAMGRLTPEDLGFLFRL